MWSVEIIFKCKYAESICFTHRCSLVPAQAVVKLSSSVAGHIKAVVISYKKAYLFGFFSKQQILQNLYSLLNARSGSV